uniref:DUF3899 domain-containing protein n=1 Tax=Steinernema glaseri TaxID=37863 RepID=A0A1I7YXA6_9BILA
MWFTTIEDYIYRAFVFFTIFGIMLQAIFDDLEGQLDLLIFSFKGIMMISLFFSTAARTTRYVCGYESMKDASRSVEYLTFLAVTALLLVIVCWFRLFHRYLKYESGEIAEGLVNYDASKERKTPLTERLRTFVYKHRNWSIYGWVRGSPLIAFGFAVSCIFVPFVAFLLSS